MSTAKTSILNWRILLALVGVYLIWGSTYLGIHIGLKSFSPFILLGLRFLLAGVVLLFWQWRSGQVLPTALEWRNAAIIGGLMLMGGTGVLGIAQKYVQSGIASIVIATVPLWVALLSGISGGFPVKEDWLGLLFGLLGIFLLKADAGLGLSPLGLILLLGASINWAIGSLLSRRLKIASGITGFASEMLMGGILCLLFAPLVAYLQQDTLWHAPTFSGWLALLYLATFGSMIGYSSYMYLFQTVPAPLATSYAYVNPVVAVLLGAVFAGEQITRQEVLAMLVILAAVVWIVSRARK